MKWFLVIIYVMANPADVSKQIKMKSEIIMPSRAICMQIKSINYHMMLECIGKRPKK